MRFDSLRASAALLALVAIPSRLFCAFVRSRSARSDFPLATSVIALLKSRSIRCVARAMAFVSAEGNDSPPHGDVSKASRLQPICSTVVTAPAQLPSLHWSPLVHASVSSHVWPLAWNVQAAVQHGLVDGVPPSHASPGSTVPFGQSEKAAMPPPPTP